MLPFWWSRAVQDLVSRSFIMQCLVKRPALFIHDRPWIPKALTAATHACGRVWRSCWPQFQSDGYADGFFIMPQSTGADWHDIKPIATVRGLRCHLSGFTGVIGATTQSASQYIMDWCIIPCLLFCGSSVSESDRIEDLSARTRFVQNIDFE